MLLRSTLAGAALAILAVIPAYAATSNAAYTSSNPYATNNGAYANKAAGTNATSTASNNNYRNYDAGAATPDMVSFGIADYDFDKSDARTQSVDMRLEYRWGLSLLPLISPSLRVVDSYIQFHPLVGGELTSRGALYGLGGFAGDVPLGRHVVFTWSEAVGLYEAGNSKPLGSFVEFRSQAELGYRFDNNMRLSAEFSHISNAGLTQRNPGAEIVGAYLHVPVDTLISGARSVY